MDTPQFPGETTPPPHSGQQRFPTLRHCLEQFLDVAPAYYVRWHGEDMEVERFVARCSRTRRIRPCSSSQQSSGTMHRDRKIIPIGSASLPCPPSIISMRMVV